VRPSHPGRVVFRARGETKLDLVRYDLPVGDGIVRGLRERPCMLYRFPSGVAGDRYIRSGFRPGRRRGCRRCGWTCPATVGMPMSCA